MHPVSGLVGMLDWMGACVVNCVCGVRPVSMIDGVFATVLGNVDFRTVVVLAS